MCRILAADGQNGNRLQLKRVWDKCFKFFFRVFEKPLKSGCDLVLPLEVHFRSYLSYYIHIRIAVLMKICSLKFQTLHRIKILLLLALHEVTSNLHTIRKKGFLKTLHELVSTFSIGQHYKVQQ